MVSMCSPRLLGSLLLQDRALVLRLVRPCGQCRVRFCGNLFLLHMSPHLPLNSNSLCGSLCLFGALVGDTLWRLLVLPFRFLMGSCVLGLHPRFSPGVQSWLVAATSEFWVLSFLPSRCDDCVFLATVSHPLAGRFHRHEGWRSVSSRSYVGIRRSDYTSPRFSGPRPYGHLGCFGFPARVFCSFCCSCSSSGGPAPSPNPYVSRSPPARHPSSRPPHVRSVSQSGDASRHPSCPARTARARSRSPLPLPALGGQSSSPLPRDLPRLFCPVLSCPDNSPPSHGWARPCNAARGQKTSRSVSFGKLWPRSI